MDRDEMRALFRVFAAHRVKNSGWSREDVREAGQSVADALESEDVERIRDAWTWLRIEVDRINGVARPPDSKAVAVAEVAPAKARVPQLKRKSA